MATEKYKISFHVPTEAVESVKSAMFNAGGGRLGHYDCCAWQTQGQGQFRPLSGSKPYIGKLNEITTVAEYKVEMICIAEVLVDVIAALKRSHPYETPSYHVLPLVDI